jgi:hypothetical protein
MEVVLAENEALKQAIRRFEEEVLSLSSSLGPALAAAAHHGALPTGLSFLMEGGTREGSLMRQPERLPSWATSGAMGAVSAQYDAASQLASAAARLSTCAAHLSGLAAKAAMVPIHSTYAQLSDEIRRYEARCHAHLAKHASAQHGASPFPTGTRHGAMPTWPSMHRCTRPPSARYDL